MAAVDRLIRADEIDFGVAASTPVVSDTLRFVLPVPALAHGGELLRHPDGSAFLDRQGRPLQGRGVVFFNEDDKCWQTARGDGRDVIIFAPIDQRQAEALGRRIAQLAPRLDLLTLGMIKDVIRFAHDELGVRSAYNASRTYVATAMTPVAALAHAGSGLVRRHGSDTSRAVYIPGTGGFVGPGATPQRFEGGAVIVSHGEDVRLVQCASFEQAYRHPDGRPARIADLAVQSP